MKWYERTAKCANTILMIFVAFFAAVLIICGLYVLNDIYYVNRTSFISYDLLKYRPTPTSEEETYTFSELKAINSDTVGWIEMFDTNINYPVVQGRNDLEYLNKDIFGYNTLSGAIYLAAENNSNFDDWYNIIYGHHMDNGAMFSDIEKYLDPDFFNSHSEGILQTVNGDFSIKVLACIHTNAYENIVYHTQDDEAVKYPQLCEYIKEHSTAHTELPESMNDSKLLGLSTCTDATTDGRIVLFASVQPWDDATDGNAAKRMALADDKNDNEPLNLKAEGHKLGGGKWSFLNLMCVLCTFLTLLPTWALKRKFGQFKYSEKKIKELEENKKYENTPVSDNNKIEQIISDLKHFIKKGRLGLIAELLMLIISVIAFILTEDLKGRMGIRDKWTGIMILIAATALTIDFVCLRYRGERPDVEIVKET
jgi:SrtB family sortase